MFAFSVTWNFSFNESSTSPWTPWKTLVSVEVSSTTLLSPCLCTPDPHWVHKSRHIDLLSFCQLAHVLSLCSVKKKLRSRSCNISIVKSCCTWLCAMRFCCTASGRGNFGCTTANWMSLLRYLSLSKLLIFWVSHLYVQETPSKAPTTTIACFPIPVNALFVGKRCGMRTAGKLCRPSRACRLVFSKRVSSLSLVGSTLVFSN